MSEYKFCIAAREIQLRARKEDNVTISIDIDLNELMNSVNGDLSLNPMRTFVFLLESVGSIKVL